jgi:hypothetical protein
MPGYRRAYKTARRLVPLALEAYRRWDNLSDEDKERYRQQAMRYSKQALAYAREAASHLPPPMPGGDRQKHKHKRR